MDTETPARGRSRAGAGNASSKRSCSEKRHSSPPRDRYHPPIIDAPRNKRPEPAVAKARLRENAKHYAKKYRDRFGPYDRGRHRLAEVSKIAMHRRRIGRDDLDFNPLLKSMKTDPSHIWSPRMVSIATQLTWDEYQELGIRT